MFVRVMSGESKDVIEISSTDLLAYLPVALTKRWNHKYDFFVCINSFLSACLTQ